MSRSIDWTVSTFRRPDPAVLRRGVEIVLVALLAAQCARLIWAAATPVGPLGEPVAAQASAVPLPVDTSALERFRPTSPLVAASIADPTAVQAAAPVEPAISLTLHGVRGAMLGIPAVAIIAGPDGKQEPYRVGQEIAPGVRLSGIGREHVVVMRGGAPTRLVFGAAAPVSSPAQASVPPSVAAGGAAQTSAPAPATASVDPAALAAQSVFVPRLENGRQNGVTVQARGGGEALAQAGLRPGDVITAVNGRALDSAERQSELAGELAGGKEAEIRFVRDGITITSRVRLGR